MVRLHSQPSVFHKVRVHSHVEIMPTLEDLVAKYESSSDEELLFIHAQIDEYSDEAKQALQIVLERKGGLHVVQARLEDKGSIEREITSLEIIIAELFRKGKSSAEVRRVIESDILSSDQIEEIIEGQYREVEAEKEDKRIKPRSIIGSLIGGVVGGTIGGIVWGGFMIYSDTIFVAYVIALVRDEHMDRWNRVRTDTYVFVLL